MPLGMEVGLGPGYTVLDVDPAPPNMGIAKKDHSSPHFWPMAIVAKRLGGSGPLGTEVGLGKGEVVLDGDLAPPHGKGHSSSHAFWPTLLWHGRPSQLLLSTC